MGAHAVGEDVVLTFVRPDGSVGQRHPLRVVADDGTRLLGWLPVGTPIVGSRLVDGRTLREAPLAERFRVPRVPVHDVWRGTSTLRLVDDERWSSVWWFFAGDGTFTGWYVNLEIPCGRDAHGPVRIDGVVDVVVEPDGTWRWKDLDEAAAAVEAGRLTQTQLERLRDEGRRCGELAERGAYPFDGTWTDFRPEPGTPAPRVPAALLRDVELVRDVET
ncbi:hypothetical protein BJF85_00440 [Saccharomonospora sp. CUA-673]|nr:hypothetical protein BJF85_00440 [Saccharomonospora sp. CUA-673]